MSAQIPIELSVKDEHVRTMSDVLRAMNLYQGELQHITSKLTLNVRGNIPLKDLDDDRMICMLALFGIHAIQSLTPGALQRLAEAARRE